MPLHLVPPSEPSLAEQITLRVKAMPKREPGMMQCPRCGSRTQVKVTNGAYIVNNRKRPGTTILEGACADCYLRGIRTFMETQIKPAT